MLEEYGIEMNESHFTAGRAERDVVMSVAD